MVFMRPKLRWVQHELARYAVFVPNICASVALETNIGNGGRHRHDNDVVGLDAVKGNDFVFAGLRPGDNSGRSWEDSAVGAFSLFPIIADLGKAGLYPVLQIIGGGDIGYGGNRVVMWR